MASTARFLSTPQGGYGRSGQGGQRPGNAIEQPYDEPGRAFYIWGGYANYPPLTASGWVSDKMVSFSGCSVVQGRSLDHGNGTCRKRPGPGRPVGRYSPHGSPTRSNVVPTGFGRTTGTRVVGCPAPAPQTRGHNPDKHIRRSAFGNPSTSATIIRGFGGCY